MGKPGALIPVLALLALAFGLVSGGNFNDDCDATWEPQNCWVYDAGNSLSLALVSNSSGQSILNEISSLICPCTNASTLVCRLMRPISFHFHDCIFVAVRLDDPVQETVHLRDRLHMDPARQGQLCRHRHNILRKNLLRFLFHMYCSRIELS
jgi:hypothetical protein